MTRFLASVLGLTIIAAGIAGGARAQDTPLPPVAVEGEAANGPRQKTLNDLLLVMSRNSNAAIVADSSVGTTPAIRLSEPTTPANFERQIEELVRSLPKGTTWAKLYLPAAPTRKGYNGDDVAQFAFAQMRLVGSVGAAPPPGTVEIFGQRVPADKAAIYIQGLNLQPVYLITNPSARANAGQQTSWADMTPEQQKATVARQAQTLLNMDPAARAQMMQQQFQVFAQFMQQMPPDQRQSFMQSMMGGGMNMRFMTAPPPGPPTANP